MSHKVRKLSNSKFHRHLPVSLAQGGALYTTKQPTGTAGLFHFSIRREPLYASLFDCSQMQLFPTLSYLDTCTYVTRLSGVKEATFHGFNKYSPSHIPGISR